MAPEHLARSEWLDEEYRLGRSKPLTNYQKYFKAGWKLNQSRRISEKAASTYKTDILQWTCSCGRQKYDPFLLCKHLVQAVPAFPIKFWTQLHRRRVKPFYWHPDLVSHLQNIDQLPFPSAAASTDDVNNGDDRIWTGDKELLRGGGGWKTLREDNMSLLGKRIRPVTDEGERRDVAQPHPSSESAAVNLIPTSSPSTSPMRSSSPVGYGSDDEHQVCIHATLFLTVIESTSQIDLDHEFAENLMADLTDAVGFIRSQVAVNNHKWLSSLKRHSWVKGIHNFTSDLQHHTQSGRRRGTTWGSRDKDDARNSKTVMGFIQGQDRGLDYNPEGRIE